ncbi:membrane protein [Psychromonas marina]|uniref:Membrane protein n=1 Tax=Psychromonas marina TaxID=88364 RepID=A0ABQ6E599_9GAMM|nr:YeeE/YedE thiosulfate transporter family protein [Psychromonas marina]GLS92562.1 membrane protein [Psychromonas marina]
MENFTPWTSLAGGALLGLSAALLMLFSGKIAGISGVIGGLLSPKKHESSWRAAFLTGMVLSVLIVAPLGFSLPDISGENILLVSFAGLLVGFGTRLGNGCTSGHGIIGMGRFSKRSIYATIAFMASAIVMVFVRSLFGAV